MFWVHVHLYMYCFVLFADNYNHLIVIIMEYCKSHVLIVNQYLTQTFNKQLYTGDSSELLEFILYDKYINSNTYESLQKGTHNYYN